jgi:hypothetical protein
MRPTAWCWTWTAPRCRFTADRSRARTTGTSSPPAITPAVVQPRRRLPGGDTAPGQRPQRRGLGGTATARDRAATAAGQGGGLSCRRGLRQAGALRGAGRTESEVHHPPAGQRQSGAQGCAVAEAASGKAKLQAGGSVQKLLLSSGQLEERAASSGEGGVPLRGVVPAGGVYRDQLPDFKPGGGALLQQTFSLPPPRHSSRECHLFVTPGEYAAPIRNVQTSQSGGEDSATTQKCSGDLRSNKIKGVRTRYAHRRRYGRLDRNGCIVD